MIVKCKAQDPSTCRYHHAGAGQIALAKFNKAETRLAEATTVPAKEKALSEWQEARDVYDATDEGYANLRSQSRQARIDGNWAASIESTTRLIKAKIVRSEERQKGAVTETVFLDTGSMNQKLTDVEKMAIAARSDRFLDIYDKYSPGLKNAAIENDSYSFTKRYNELVNELRSEGNEARWMDVNEGRKWVAEAGKLQIKGKVHRTLIPLDNPNVSMVFEA